LSNDDAVQAVAFDRAAEFLIAAGSGECQSNALSIDSVITKNILYRLYIQNIPGLRATASKSNFNILRLPMLLQIFTKMLKLC
jgi:hypothetical protein